MKGRGIAVALGLGTLGALALMTRRRPPHRRDPAFDEPMVPPPPGPPEEHPIETTPLAYEQAREWLAWAYSAETAELAPATALAMLLAHSAIETGQWAKMHGNNFGNVTALGRDRPYFIIRGITEYVGGKPVKVDMAFRWYPDPGLGAWDFVHVLRTSFPKAWALLESDDPSAYATALADAGYYTGSREKYAAGLASLYLDFKHRELGRLSA
jgi:hypothetical protein